MLNSIRLPAVAGSFYPGQKEELKTFIRSLPTTDLSVNSDGKLRGLVVPHAGYLYSGLVANHGFSLMKFKKLNNPKILLLGPSHHKYFNGLAACSYEMWKTPLGMVKIDAINSVMASKFPNLISFDNEAHRDEHCLEVEIPFLQMFLKDFSLIPLLTGEGDFREFAAVLKYYEKNIDLFIISSDLSHYYPYEKALSLDAIANKEIPNLNIDKTLNRVEACGKQGILTIMQLAKQKKWQGRFIDYKNSGDTAGNKEAVVGYGAYGFYEQ